MAINLFATGLVVLLGLVFGRYVIDSMWADSSTPTDFSTAVVGPSGFANNELMHVLDFGDVDGTFHYQSLAGNYDTITTALRRRTVELTKSAKLVGGPPAPAEATWLVRAEKMNPVASQQGEWQVFEKDGPVPVAVGVREIPDRAQLEESQKVAIAGSRVVCWSIAIPSIGKDENENAGDRWALFTFVPGGESGKPSEYQSLLPLPPDTTRIMSLHSDHGATMMGFKGVTIPGDVTRHFDELADDRGWRSTGHWQVLNETWTKLYTTDGQSVIHITFARQHNDSIRGLVMLAPAAPIVEEQSR